MEDTAANQQIEKVAVEQGECVVTAYKGFNKDFVCHPSGGQRVQYAVGETFEIDGKIEACERGFHACEFPLDVFGYYAPADSRFASVEMSGELSRENSDSKIAAARISIKAELKIPELVSRAVSYILSRVESSKTES
ncbi:DUF7666 domain-containing protein, partial [Cupriavidus basilensis]|uniref:DUF7666 domain-containing protein n=1 Tax=Cupriavidus basilensis TaxID=68895 RepID=UPI003F912279